MGFLDDIINPPPKQGLFPPPQTVGEAGQNIFTRATQAKDYAKERITAAGEQARQMTGIMDKWSQGTATPEEKHAIVNDYMQYAALIGGGTAYHGTPHEWGGNKPDISKVGTGQGAQSYGHGMYFAEAKPVAESYAREAQAIAVYNHPQYPGKSVVMKGNQVVSVHNTAAAANAARDKLPGNLYQVNIPDEHVAKMLDYDKPLSQQSDFIRSALGIEKAANLKGVPKSISGDIKLIGDALISKSGAPQAFRSLDIDTRTKVVESVLRASKDNKVLDSIVSFFPVDVVDLLARNQLTPKMLLHDKSMLLDLLSGRIGDNRIPGAVKVATATENALSAAVKAVESSNPHIPIIRELGQNATGADFYKALGGGKESSDYLNSIGIPGIKYLDQGSRGVTVEPSMGGRWVVKSYGNLVKRVSTQEEAQAIADKMGTRNFVVFDPNIIKDVKKMQ